MSRPVLRNVASLDHPRGYGAWELTARIAFLDFFDVDTPTGSEGQLVGIKLPVATFGVNWYLNDRMRLMFNYNYEAPNEPNTGTSVAQIFGMRLNIFW